jgi:hypothetical protein
MDSRASLSITTPLAAEKTVATLQAIDKIMV